MVLNYTKAWLKTKEEFIDSRIEDTIEVTILVAARNEEENIFNCINSLLNQSYKKELVEIILLDDFSEDNTVEIAKQFMAVKILQLKEFLGEAFQYKANKKRAISLGVEQAKNKVIITTDGDCVYYKNWLKSKMQFYSKTQAKMITSPVLFFSEESVFSKFMELDLISLMGITAAGIKNKLPSMVNGANLLFEKAVFEEVNGFEGNENIASGDDVFLMQKIHQVYPNTIKFLKNNEAIAFTKAPKNFTEFVNQRIRWTSKSKKHANPKVRNVLVINVLFYLILTFGLFVLPFFNFNYFKISIVLFGLKMLVDFIFFKNLTHFFAKEKLLRSFLIIEIMHLPYISILGFLSLLSNYTWKGRKV